MEGLKQDIVNDMRVLIGTYRHLEQRMAKPHNQAALCGIQVESQLDLGTLVTSGAAAAHEAVVNGVGQARLVAES
jgi:hypothetical protein